MGPPRRARPRKSLSTTRIIPSNKFQPPGDADACALLSDGTACRCWGNVLSWPGQITWTTQKQVQFPAGTTIAQITHGDHHACAITTDATPLVYCWGSNQYGQLGQPASATAANSYVGAPLQVPLASASISNGPAPGQVSQVVASGNSTCVLATGADGSAGNVYCWGDDTMGSLGDNGGAPGNWTYQPVFVAQQPSGFGFGTVPYVALTGSSIGSAGAYGSFCAAMSTNGTDNTWFCWGADDQGQLDVDVPALTPSGEVQGVPAPTVMKDTTIQAAGVVAIGANHGCAIASNSLYCFGDNDDGQVGVATGVGSGMDLPYTMVSPPPAGFPSASFTGVAVGDNMTCGTYLSSASSYGTPSAKGNIACWGGDGILVSSYAPAFLTW